MERVSELKSKNQNQNQNQRQNQNFVSRTHTQREGLGHEIDFPRARVIWESRLKEPRMDGDVWLLMMMVGKTILPAPDSSHAST